MQEKKMFFKQVRSMLIMIIAITASFMSNAEESAEDGLKRCGLIGNASERLACYDQLGGRENSADVKITQPITASKPELAPESVASQSKQQIEPESAIVRVTKCNRSGGNNKYIFSLENGQVWKQISDKRMHLKDCNFGVSIHKDFFGYKMQIEDTKKKKFRVSRIH